MSNEWGGVILNSGCSNFCVFCGLTPEPNHQKLREQEISVEKNLLEFKKDGINKIEISGCDPIEYDKIVQLIKHIKEMGFEHVTLSTHGKRLSNELFLKELISSGINQLRIPVYGSNAKIHDSVTRTEGSFNDTLKGIIKLNELSSNIKIQISSLILQENKDDLVNLVELVSKLRIDDFYFSIPFLSNMNHFYYIPIKDIGPYAKRVCNYPLKFFPALNFSLKFMEIPYCVFGKIDEKINNSSLPPNLGKHCQPPKSLKTKTKNLPSYRIKRKVEMCKECNAYEFCDGFIANDIDKFGIGDLKPIK